MNYKQLYHLSIFIIIGFIAFASCKKDKIEAKYEIGHEYTPLQKDYEWIYQVDSIVFNDFTSTVDTFSYQIKELIANYQITDNNNLECVIERYYRKNQSLNWRLIDTWTCTRNSGTYEKVIENQRYIKLAFPIKYSQKWNVNAYNTEEKIIASLDSIGEKRVINNKIYDNTVKSNIKDFFSLISEDIYYEIYAKNIGLVYIRNRHVQKKTNGIIYKGYDYNYKLISFNNSNTKQ